MSLTNHISQPDTTSGQATPTGDGVGFLRRMLKVLPFAAVSFDLGVVTLAMMAAAQLRETRFLFDEPASLGSVGLVMPLMGVLWVAIIAMRGGHHIEVFGAGVDEFKRVLNATVYAAGAVGIACYLAQYPLSRGFFVYSFLIGLPLLMVERWVLRRVVQRARRQGHFRRKVVIVGNVPAIDGIASVLQRETWLGYEVLGALTPAHDLTVETPHGVPVVGNLDDAASMAPALGADLVFFADGGVASNSHMRAVMWELEHHDVHVVVAPSVTDISSERVRVRPVGGLPLIHLGKPRSLQALSQMKRGFDIVGSSLLILCALPLLVLATLRVKLHDRGPVMFRQQRVGQGGSTFDCLKFRTMVVDAEARLAALHEETGHDEGLFKMKDDPRITGPGRWLRRFSVDELPQLFNVLKGDMSLVGPRPALPSEVATYDVTAARRLRVRPGLTGLWQVSGRSNLSWAETVRLDVYYVDNWSMLQDISILAKTAKAVLGSDGAY
ncbi:sugar transferase [Nocardioides aestuarii]|uniref:Sugar transferase n=1 Tax=Nocardioides aestuarii TaxID=252231 RepID=A0ABW4TMV3_9ACTN